MMMITTVMITRKRKTLTTTPTAMSVAAGGFPPVEGDSAKSQKIVYLEV